MSKDDREPVKPSVSAELPDYIEESGSEVSRHVGWLSYVAKFKKILIVGTVILLCLVLAPTAYRLLKNLRAEMLVTDSATAFAIGDNSKAISYLKQSLALSPSSTAVKRAVELYNARAGDKTSMENLVSRMRSSESSSGELLGIAEIGLQSGNLEVTKEALAHLPPTLDSQESLRLALVRAATLVKGGDIEGAAKLCLTNTTSMNKSDVDRLRTQGAMILISLGKGGDDNSLANAVDVLLDVVRGRSAAALPAWRIILHLGRSSKSVPNAQQLSEMMAIFPSLKGATVSDQLLAAGLELNLSPKNRDSVVERLTRKYSHASRSEMLEFARWLNALGLHQEAITFAGEERFRSDTDWLLVALDAESAQGHWKELREMMDSSAGAGIPDAVRHLFLARAAMMTGDQTTSDEEWRNVGGALHLEKPETLAYIGAYEEQIGAFDKAARTYREMADRNETKVPGLIALIRCQPRNVSAVALIPMYEELLAAAPDFREGSGDLAYLKLLVLEDIPNSSKLAEQLLAAQSNSLSLISSAALGRLRLGDFTGALALYNGKIIDWATAPDPWKAVRVAVLNATGDYNSADKLAASINAEQLRPEERELLKKPVKGSLSNSSPRSGKK